MPARDNPEAEMSAYRQPDDPNGADSQRLLNTLDRVFTTFREQLATEAPKPFTGNAKIAADTFNDIVAGLKFEAGRPKPVTVTATRVSPTEIDLLWTDRPGNADGYRVERCQGLNCDPLDEIQVLGPAARSFQDVTVSKGAAYSYRVVAFDGRGETAYDPVDVSANVSARS